MTDDPFPRLRLLFFRELDRTQRLRILVGIGGLPNNLTHLPNMGIERKALEWIRDNGKLPELETMMNQEIKKSITTPDPKPNG